MEDMEILKGAGPIQLRSDVLVIVPSFGQFPFVRKTIRSLVACQEQTKFRVVISLIDDASPDWASAAIPFETPELGFVYRFKNNEGLTRSWNAGLRLARDLGIDYTICANSDLLYSPGWLDPLIGALNDGFALVGPLTNAPGHAQWQSVEPFCTDRKTASFHDSPENISGVAEVLKRHKVGPIELPLNGFLLAARTDTWWRGAYDDNNVFNPAYPLEHNEVELQTRWMALGMRIAMVPQSYVFHYRSVSRPAGLNGLAARGAFRPLGDPR